MDRQRPPQEVLDPVGRVQRAEGILEDHLQLGAEGSRGLEAVALEDVDAVDQDLPGARLFQPGNTAGQGALAGTGLSHEGHDFAAANGQVDAVQGPDRVPGEQTAYGERLSQSSDLEGWGFGVEWRGAGMTVQSGSSCGSFQDCGVSR